MAIEHTYMTKDGHKTGRLIKAKAIRQKCLECCCWQESHVLRCTCHDCALFPFRFGNEKGLQRVWIEERQEFEDWTC
jgi:hypothetical protein